MIIRFPTIVAASFFALWLTGCANPAAKPTKAGAKSTVPSADVLMAEALAAFQVQRDGGRALTLLAAAAQQAPTRPDVAYVQMSLCGLIEGCQPEAFETRLRKLDAANGAVWIGALMRAQRQGDRAVESQVLDALGRSERFDMYWNVLGANLTRVRSQGTTGVEAKLNETLGWMGATIVPAFAALTTACSRLRTSEAEWAARCGRVAKVLLNSDTYLAESVGLRLALQVTADTLASAQLAERARTSRYRWRATSEIIGTQLERDKFALELLELMTTLRREQDVHLAVVRWAGQPITPSADFSMDE